MSEPRGALPGFELGIVDQRDRATENLAEICPDAGQSRFGASRILPESSDRKAVPKQPNRQGHQTNRVPDPSSRLRQATLRE